MPRREGGISGMSTQQKGPKHEIFPRHNESQWKYTPGIIRTSTVNIHPRTNEDPHNTTIAH